MIDYEMIIDILYVDLSCQNMLAYYQTFYEKQGYDNYYVLLEQALHAVSYYY